MCHRVTAIKEYYINLDYVQINKVDAISKISVLAQHILQKGFNITPERLNDVASIIKENLVLFAPFCKHIDIITTIVHYLTFFSEIKMDNSENSFFTKDFFTKTAALIYLTLYNVCPETEVRSFLNTTLGFMFGDEFQSTYLNEQIIEMIILEDSDLDAVVNCLKIIEKEAVTKIWIQERIKEKFLWFKMKYFCDSNFSIHTFRSKRELFTPNIYNKVNIASIWSEDVVAAKCLAKSLNKTILFINTHMDFYDSNMLIPYGITDFVYTASAILNSGDFKSKSNKDKLNATQASKMMFSRIYNLFYDGKWQMSTNTTYCKYDNSLWANATHDDIRKCVNSAQKGFEIWSTKSIHLKKELLYNVLYAVECSGHRGLKYLLELLFPHSFSQFNKSYTHVTEKGFEITQEHMPLGIVILKEKDEDDLFHRLFNLLLAGNSAIVIHNSNFYNFSLLCDIFATCGMPPGVINVLSNDDIESLELYLCKYNYSSYTKIYNLTTTCPGYPVQSKSIILPLK